MNSAVSIGSGFWKINGNGPRNGTTILWFFDGKGKHNRGIEVGSMLWMWAGYARSIFPDIGRQKKKLQEESEGGASGM